jgi:predicted secreted protein
MNEAATMVGRLTVHFLRALGIKDRAFDDLLVLGLATFIIFGLLGIITLKIAMVRAQERDPDRGLATPTPTPTKPNTARKVIKALVWIGALLAVSLIIALRLNS